MSAFSGNAGVYALAALANGELIAVTDNDGVEDATGETLLLRLGKPQMIN